MFLPLNVAGRAINTVLLNKCSLELLLIVHVDCTSKFILDMFTKNLNAQLNLLSNPKGLLCFVLVSLHAW